MPVEDICTRLSGQLNQSNIISLELYKDLKDHQVSENKYEKKSDCKKSTTEFKLKKLRKSGFNLFLFYF